MNNLGESMDGRSGKRLAAPAKNLGGVGRAVRSHLRVWMLAARLFRRHNIMAMCSALSFRTIFALVPVLILSLLVLKSLGVMRDSRQAVRDLLQRAGLSQIVYVAPQEQEGAATPEPADVQAVNLAEKIEALVAKAESSLTLGRIGPVGVVLLIWAAITLLTTIERSLNRIFEAPRSRPLGRRVLLYWSVVTLGPVALIAAGLVGRGLMDRASRMDLLAWPARWIGWLGPVLVAVALLAAFYRLMPNTRVAIRWSLVGAVVAIPLWLVLRWAFALYVEHVGRKSLYGAMGIVPLFLMWLNLSWLIFLGGAAFAHAGAHREEMDLAERQEKQAPGAWDLLGALLAVAQQNRATGRPVELADVAAGLGLSQRATRGLLLALTKEGFICPVEGRSGAFLPARPLDRIGVWDVLRIGPSGDDSGLPRQVPVCEAMEKVRGRVRTGVEDLTIAAIMAD